MTAHATPDRPASESADAPLSHEDDLAATSSRTPPPAWSDEDAADAWGGVVDLGRSRTPDTAGTAGEPEAAATAEDWVQGPVATDAPDAVIAPETPESDTAELDPVHGEPEPATDELGPTAGQPDPEAEGRWLVVEESPSALTPELELEDGPARAQVTEAGAGPDRPAGAGPDRPDSSAESLRRDLRAPDATQETAAARRVRARPAWARRTPADRPPADNPTDGPTADRAPADDASVGRPAGGGTPAARSAAADPTGTSPGTAAAGSGAAGGGIAPTGAVGATTGAAATGPASAPTAPTGAAARTDHSAPSARRGTLAAALELLAPHLRPQRPALVTGMITLVLAVAALVAVPLTLRRGLDAATAAAGADQPFLDRLGADPVAALTTAAIALAVLALLGLGLRAVSATALDQAGSRAATALRARLLHHLHRLSPGRDIEDLEGTATPLVEDVASLRELVARTGPRLLGSLLALVMLLVVVLVLAPVLAPVLLVTAVLGGLVSALTLGRRRQRDAVAESEDATLAETAHELLAATRTVQSYGLEDHAAGTLAEIGARAARSRSAARRTRVLGTTLSALVAAAGAVAVLLIGGERAAGGAGSPGELGMALLYAVAAVPLAGCAVRSWASLARAASAADGISALLSHTAAIGEPPRTQSVGPLRGEVVFSAITAGPGRGPRFDGVSVVIPVGQRVALMDRSGAEASALLSYLLRFEQPETGRVLLDRYDTRSLSLADLRGALAVVQREPALFSETVRENVRAGRPGASDEEVAEAVRRSGADTLLDELPDGYDTLLTRRGAALADGRRRRLAIARALLRDAPVVLLDRADAELAPRERAEVLAALDALGEGRTVLLHSREPETVRGADRVLWFEDGRLVEDGDPRVLAEDPDSRLSAWLREADEPEV